MKHKLLLTLASMFLATSLVACTGGQKGPESDSKEDESSEPETSSEEIKGWSDADKVLFDEYLYGVEIPFIDLDGTLEYDDTYEELVYETTSGDVPETFLEEYGALFTKDEGWLAADEYGTAFIKEVTTEAGKRNAYVTFDINEGNFALEAYDPYYYDWPTDLVGAILAYFESEATLPAFEADKYEVDTSLIAWGIDYASIYCYTDQDAEDAVGDYYEILDAASWVIGEPDSDGYYVAIAPTEDLQIQFGFDTTYGDLDINITPYSLALTEWPVDEAAGIVGALVPGSTTVVPAFEGGSLYDVWVGASAVAENGYGEIDIYQGEEHNDSDALDALITAYEGKLNELGWQPGTGEWVSPAGDIAISFSNEDYETFYVCELLIYAVEAE